MRVLCLTVLCFFVWVAGAGAATFTLSSGTGLSITGSAPTQVGRTAVNGTSSTCASPKAAPGRTSVGTNFFYYGTSVSNRTDASVCLTYTVTPSCSPTSVLWVTAYAGNFDPSNLVTSYLADPGDGVSSGATSFSGTLPALSTSPLIIASSTGCTSFSYSITAPRPVALSSPDIPEALAVGVPNTVYPGYWPGSNSPTYTYQWQRCNADGTGCAAVAGATTNTYTPTPTDEGHAFKIRVTNTDTGASGTALSAASNVVAANPPAPKVTAKSSTGSELIPGTALVANTQGDDAVADVGLPFPVTIGGISKAKAFVSTNGNLQFVDALGATKTIFSNTCLPAAAIPQMVAPYWDDLDTQTSISSGLGVYTATTGTAPHRTFVVEWRAAKHNDTTKRLNFEVLLHEDSPVVSFLYGKMDLTGNEATIGYQGIQAPAYVTQTGCNQDGKVPTGTQIDYTPSAPAIAGTAQAGQTLTGTDAEYVSGRTPLTSATSWESCTPDGTDCAQVQNGGGTFALTPALVGRSIRLSSTATGPDGEAKTTSALTAPVSAIPTVAPTASPSPNPTVVPQLKPALTSVKLSKSTLKRKQKTTLTATGNVAGTLKVVLARKTTGRKKGKKCVKATRKNRKAKRCSRYVTARTLKAALAAGKSGTVTIKGKGLKKGRYRLTATLTAGTLISAAVTKTLKVR